MHDEKVFSNLHNGLCASMNSISHIDIPYAQNFTLDYAISMFRSLAIEINHTLS